MKKVIYLTLILMLANVVQAKTVWKIQSHKEEGSLLNQNFIKYIVNPINKELSGEFELKLFTQDKKNSLHSNVTSFSQVRYANVEGMFSASMYWGSIDPVFAIFGDLVAAWEKPDDFLKWFDDENGRKYIQKAYDKYNMKFVGFSLTPHESLITRVPINNLKELKGKIVRVPPGSMGVDLFNKLGAISRPTPMSKVSSSFKNKGIDIADYSTVGVNLNENIYKNAKYTIYPGFHSLPVLDFIVNKDKWDALSPKIKKVILKHTLNWRYENIKNLNLADHKALEEIKKLGVKAISWGKEDLKETRKVAVSVWESFAAKSQNAKDLVNSIKSWLKKNGRL